MRVEVTGFGSPGEIGRHLLAKVSYSGRHLQYSARVGTRSRKAKTGADRHAWRIVCGHGKTNRPYSITTLIFFYIGTLGPLFRRRR